MTYILIEYIAHDANTTKHAAISALRNACAPALDVVQGVCNGAKRAGSSGKFNLCRGKIETFPFLHSKRRVRDLAKGA
ncbi:MAG: hypothetical protein N2444_09985 [Methylocystis sp.]|nr:hypothetical protein [Methylocystis sp.]